MNRQFSICVLAVCILLLSYGLAGAKKFAAVGIPLTQTRGTVDSAVHLAMDNNQKVSNRLVIIEEAGKYYWETRDHSELIYIKLRRSDLFIDPKTGGYIKVVKQEDGSFAYLEHISFEDFRTFTYWGMLNVYQP